MFALGIRYLNGWAMATHPVNREKAEWPPHPDRVFMALAAAHFETDGGPDERAALEWLESLPAPSLAVCEAEHRDVVTSFVPVNDTEIARRGPEEKRLAAIGKADSLNKARDAGLAVLPEFRNRQPRSFPVAIPIDEHTDGDAAHMHLIWDVDAQEPHIRALDALCAKVVSIGHSASLVQMWTTTAPPNATLVPVDGLTGTHRLRVMGSTRLAQLESRFKAELRPNISLWQGYTTYEKTRIETRLASTVFDTNLIVLRRVDGPQLGLESVPQLIDALHGAVMGKCGVQPVPEWISGHKPAGGPSDAPHIAYVPLADVGHRHARGHLLGVAIAIPRDIPADEHQALSPVLFHTPEEESVEDGVYAGTPRTLQLTMGRAGVWRVELAEDDHRHALRPEHWTAATLDQHKGAAEWATVTPIVFDRHPRETWSASDPPRLRAERQAAYWLEVEEMIADACERIGLPRPIEVTACPASVFIGAPSAGHMPRIRRKDGSQRRQTHAVIRFGTPVVGPVLLGAGRYRGYGLCRPQPGDGGSSGGGS